MNCFKMGTLIALRGKLSYIRSGLLLVMTLFMTQLMAQQSVSGSVSDSDGPLPGATIVVQGTNDGVSTDFDGNFSIQANAGDVLEISYVGFQTQLITVSANQDNISVTLVSDNELEEIVVTGYGTQRKINLTGAVGAVTGEVLEDRPIVNLGEGLQGVIPNLNITIRNGDPTTAPEFNIRGFESINGGTPLILVDNVPMVAASIKMFPMDIYPKDGFLWQLLAFCAGTGGSILIIGSAAGLAAMGIEKINFIWYVKKISLLALFGYVAGALVFIAQYNLLFS